MAGGLCAHTEQLKGSLTLKWRQKLLAVGLMLVLPLAAACSEEEDMVLRFGLLPSEDAEKVLQEAESLKAYLEGEIDGLTVELFIGPNYAATIEAMKSNEVDFAYFGPFSYFIARATGAEVVSELAFQQGDTSPGYYSVIYARADSDVKSLADLMGQEGEIPIALVDPGSTSGNLAPQAMFLAAGLDLAKLAESTVYAGGHDKSALATFQGTAEVGASFEAMLYDLCGQGLIAGVVDAKGGGQYPGDCSGNTGTDADMLVTLEKFLLPASPIAARTNMDEELRTQVIDAMLAWSTNDPEGFSRFAEVTEGTDDDTDVKLVRYGHENYSGIEAMCSSPELAEFCPK